MKPAVQEAANPVVTSGRPSRSILVVAKENAARGALVEALEAAGHLVVTARHGAQAREILQTLVPGAMLIDLPGADAARFVKQLRANGRQRMIPRLLCVTRLSTRANPLDSAAVFVKPIEPAHLLRALAGFFTTVSVAAAPPRRGEMVDRLLVDLARASEVPPPPEASIEPAKSAPAPVVVAPADLATLAGPVSPLLPEGPVSLADAALTAEIASDGGASALPDAPLLAALRPPSEPAVAAPL